MIVDPGGVPFHHVGVLVENLEAAAQQFSELVGLTFPDRRSLTLQGSEGEDFPISFVYSSQGPPYLELIQVQDEGPWRRDLGLGVHHIGFDQVDGDSTLRRLSSLTDNPGTILHRAGGSRAIYLDPGLAASVRVELLCPVGVNPPNG